MHILGKMAETLGTARPDISTYAPRIITIKIPVEKIRDVIGSMSKTTAASTSRRQTTRRRRRRSASSRN
jgi:polyribonucleotide nucleotidyltransferase